MSKITISFFVAITSIFVFSCSNSFRQTGLKDSANFPIGTAIQTYTLLNDNELQNLQKLNFNSITATNAMKMHEIIPEEDKYTWKTVDTIVSYAKNNNQRLFGHALIWHSSTPKWVEKKGTKDSLWTKNFMKEYIQTYVSRYKGKVSGWDVVNEAFESEGGDYRKTFWYNTLGEDYIANAFKYAHQADPNATLFYNDFNIERDTVKLHSVLKMIKAFKAKGIPISGLGFQMHIRIDTPDETIAYALKKAAETGLKIHISEVDIIFNKHNDTKHGGVQTYNALTDDMKIIQAEKYKNLVLMYRKLIPKEQQYGITFWDFTDRDTWIRSFFNIDDWPSIYDDDLKPKPAYYAFKKGLEKEL